VKILLTILACIVVAVLGAVGFIYSGWYDVGALTPDNQVVAWALHNVSDRSINARLAGITVPPDADLDKPDMIKAGGHIFAENCVVCHGGPGLKPTAIAEGINPQPPNLFRANRKPRMNEMFRFIKYGVKMTAMPGFGKTHSDDDIWSVAAFLRKAPGMTPQDFATLTGMATSDAKPADAKPSGG
jgi:mono/diheme cytochrome c family protein